MSDDWNVNDPEAPKVFYDLGSWTIDQQADLAAELADREVAHAWQGAELVVPPFAEELADAIVAEVEQRHGITYDDTVGGKTEFDLDEWEEGERAAVERALTSQHIPFHWEGNTLLVNTIHEDTVDHLLDMVEAGDIASAAVDLDADAVEDSDDQLPFETLTTFFLAGERLRRDPLDADGLVQLAEIIEARVRGNVAAIVMNKLLNRMSLRDPHAVVPCMFILLYELVQARIRCVRDIRTLDLKR